MNREPILEFSNVRISLSVRGGIVHAVDGISLTVHEGQALGVVGESGAGKSISMLAVLGLLPELATVSGSIRFRGEEVIGMRPRDLRALRGGRIGMIFQDPLTALNPVLTIGAQLSEAVRLHDSAMSRRGAAARSRELLELVSIPNAASCLKSYPHEFSGGMRQRAMIAMAVANEPDLLIADEPTTALDVTVQAQVLEVLEGLKETLGLALVLITHDLGVVAGIANDIAVMYAGRIVEKGPVDDVYERPRHPYTQGLLGSLPSIDGPRGQALVPIEGAPPSLSARPSGCAFHPRCAHAAGRCKEENPALIGTGTSAVACHLVEPGPGAR